MTHDRAAQTYHHDYGAVGGQSHALPRTATLTRAWRLRVMLWYVSQTCFCWGILSGVLRLTTKSIKYWH
ncbi:hypothetical protein [Anabaena azotica]|uniref:hypothetical protein n=1 Tax=Anabaena azotica TaxID=197653 RepID=UPI001F55A37E|nr:hypothetical protein [Anabaena azotica]